MNAWIASPEPAAALAGSSRPGRLRRGWQLLHTAAVLGVLLLSPSSYRVAGNRLTVAAQLWRAVAGKLAAFTLMSSLFCLVLIRITLNTAQSFGLAPLVLEVVLRVLVLELIPLLAALFVAVEITLPAAADLARLQSRGESGELPSSRLDRILRHALPRVLAGMTALPMFAVLASVVALLMSYLVSYGATPWAFGGFTRVVGQVFGPVLLTVFAIKTFAFGAIVALLPAASVLAMPGALSGSRRALTNLVRITVLLLLVELLALIGIYL